jgi:hypothetical protein
MFKKSSLISSVFIQFILLLVSVTCSGNDISLSDLVKGEFRVKPKIDRINVYNSVTIIVLYDQAMNTDDIGLKSNYQIINTNDNILDIDSVSLVERENDQVQIITATQEPQVEYTLIVKNIRNKLGKGVGKDGISAKFEGFNISSVFVSTPPDILAPENEQKIINVSQKSTTFVWTPKFGASDYIIEIARDDGSAEPFISQSNHIDGSPFTVEAENEDEPPLTYLEINIPDAYTYKWRVRADITNEGDWSRIKDDSGNDVYASFHAFDDAVYVYCSSAETACDDSNKIGNKSSPFQTINTASATAKAMNLVAKVATRGDNAYYNELVSLIGDVKLYGGYLAPDFKEEERDTHPVSGNITTIKQQGIYTVVGMNIIGMETVLDGFTIHGGIQGNPYALYLYNSSNIVIRNCFIQLGDMYNSAGYAVYNKSSNTVFLNNTVKGPKLTGTCLASSFAVSNESSDSQFFNNVLLAGDICEMGSSYGIYNNKSNSMIVNNIINNIIIGGGGIMISDTSSSYPVYNVGSPSTPKIINNTIIGGLAGNSYGFRNASSTPIVFNNIIVVIYGTLTNNGIWGSSITNDYNCVWTNGGLDFTNSAVQGLNDIVADPLFVSGPGGDYYLSQISAGQGADSPCIDIGDNSAAASVTFDYTSLTTRTDSVLDSDPVDLGYHYTP